MTKTKLFSYDTNGPSVGSESLVETIKGEEPLTNLPAILICRRVLVPADDKRMC